MAFQRKNSFHQAILLEGYISNRSQISFGENWLRLLICIKVKMLPELAGRIAEPLKSIDKLTIVDTGHGEGAARVSNYVTSLMATAPEMLKNVSGIDLEKMVKQLTRQPDSLIEQKSEEPA